VNEPDVPILDETVLAELGDSVKGDAGFVRELIEAYLSDGASHLEAIGAAASADDAPGLVRPAHTLKSSSATLGAQRVAAMARRLEMAARSGSLDAGATAAAVAALRTEWDRAVAALQHRLAEGGG
jgi:HPt (histidine-containing phosphotransfer) domain-containing protein